MAMAISAQLAHISFNVCVALIMLLASVFTRVMAAAELPSSVEESSSRDSRMTRAMMPPRIMAEARLTCQL